MGMMEDEDGMMGGRMGGHDMMEQMHGMMRGGMMGGGNRYALLNFDADKDGTLSAEELRAGMLGDLKTYDTNGDGTLSSRFLLLLPFSTPSAPAACSVTYWICEARHTVPLATTARDRPPHQPLTVTAPVRFLFLSCLQRQQCQQNDSPPAASHTGSRPAAQAKQIRKPQRLLPVL